MYYPIHLADTAPTKNVRMHVFTEVYESGRSHESFRKQNSGVLSRNTSIPDLVVPAWGSKATQEKEPRPDM